ncbi:MAG: hypothetical protein A2Y33_10350 [Spirochaetes bacterium GWF1_51_8]|nr:MAG: hypothetical protein A2Y33_10350 [Spirochaetes bacterium GWF1_51_8]
MLLCQKHHRLVDQNPNKFSVDLLREYKKKHEAWVKDNLSLDFDKQDTDEIYSTYIDEICRLADFNDWQNWASSLVSDGQPSINKDSFERLKKLSLVLLGMVWPKRNQNREIESSIKNFNFVLKDLIFVFSKYKIGYFNSYITEKIYKIYDGNPELYNKLGKLFDFHVDLVEDLALELTRAGNFLSDQVRKYLNPFFRIKEGLLLITSGPNMDKYLSIITHRVEYSEKDIKDGLYKSLEDFMINRVNRDLHFGEGVNGDYD